jgi:hypothetical protein
MIIFFGSCQVPPVSQRQGSVSCGASAKVLELIGLIRGITLIKDMIRYGSVI